MKQLLVLIFLFICFAGMSQYFDHSFQSISHGDLEPQLIEITSNGEIVALGSNELFKTDSISTLLWAKQIDLSEIRDLKLDEDDNIYFLENSIDSNNYCSSILTKVSPDGYQVWKKQFGNGFEEVHYQTIFIEDYWQIYLGGEMKTDSIWHNVITKVNFMGNEDWSRRMFHYDYLAGNQIPKETSILKITQSPSAKLFALGQIEDKVLLYKFNGSGGLHSFEQYWLHDSLTPVDIEIIWEDNIQILMNSYSYDNHFTTRSIVRMQVDEYLEPINTHEYSKPNYEIKGKDLEVTSYGIYMLANISGGYQRSIIERTYLDGTHDLSKEFDEQDSGQFSHDFEIETDYDIVCAYKYGQNETHVLSKINPSLQSNCSNTYGNLLLVTPDTINHSVATSMTFNACYPLISTLMYSYLDIDDVSSNQECTLYNSIQTDEIGIELYPNPASEIIQIQVESGNLIEVTIYDLNGCILLNSNGSVMDISLLASGIYICQVKTTTGVSTIKLEVS